MTAHLRTFCCTSQVVDNALIAAGLVDDSRTMLPRLTALLELVLGVGHGYAGEAAIEAKRFVPERERDERAGIDLSGKLVEDMNAEIRRTAARGNPE